LPEITVSADRSPLDYQELTRIVLYELILAFSILCYSYQGESIVFGSIDGVILVVICDEQAADFDIGFARLGNNPLRSKLSSTYCFK